MDRVLALARRRPLAAVTVVVETPFRWAWNVGTYMLMRLLCVEPTLAEVRDSTYAAPPVAKGVTVQDVANAPADADALMALAERAATQSSDRTKTVQTKAGFQLTLCSLLVAAVWALSPKPLSLPARVAVLAFAVALWLLMRILQTGSSGVVEPTPKMLAIADPAAFKRVHASLVFGTVATNHGRTAFLVDVQRAASRAVLLGLVAVVWLGVTAGGAAPPTPNAHLATSGTQSATGAHSAAGAHSGPPASSSAGMPRSAETAAGDSTAQARLSARDSVARPAPETALPAAPTHLSPRP